MNILGKATDSQFWDNVREQDIYKEMRAQLQKAWQQHCEGPIYALKYSDFRLFTVTGNRSIYESPYLSLRTSVNVSALLAMIYPDEEKYLIRLMDSIYALCDTYTWCLPAHQTKLEINNNIHLDLVACETGACLSEIYILLGDRLEELIRDRIRTEVNRRVIDPYVSQKTNYWWEKCENNWASVCVGSVAACVMLMRPELFEQLKPRFDATMDGFLRGFKDDGICLEGFGYWHYGFGHFVKYADLIRKFTNGKHDLFKLEKVKIISTFIQKMMLTENCTVSFSDAGRSGRYHIGVLHYLKNEYPDAIELLDPKYSSTISGSSWALDSRALYWFDENLYRNPDKIKEAVTYYAPYSEWLVRKTPNYSFAAKGGNNNEPHNQNDVGTFIVAKKGRQLLMDVGGGEYTRQYFSKERYTIFACSSRGHSVPIFDGNLQKTGSQYKAVTAYENDTLTIEFSAAYDIPELKKCERKFFFTDDKIFLTDSFDYSGKTIVDRMVTLIKPEISEGNVTVEDVTIKFDPSKADVEINTDLHNKSTAYLIDFTLKDGVREISFEII